MHFVLYDDGDSIINAGNKLQLGSVISGTTSQIVSTWLWLDRGSLYGESAVSVFVLADAGGVLLTGTNNNGFTSMLEARSRGSIDIPSDNHEAWIKICRDSLLEIGLMISGTARNIEFRISAPYDAGDLVETPEIIIYSES